MNSATEPFSTMSARVGEHRVADGELGGVQSRLLDDAGDVPAGHDRKAGVDEAAQVALADLVVDGVDPGGDDPHHQGVGADVRLLTVGELEAVVAAEIE
jgi:hypothetical protein